MSFLIIIIGILIIYFAAIGIYFTVIRIWLTIDANRRIKQLKRVRKGK